MGTRILVCAAALVLADCLWAQEHLRLTGTVVDEEGVAIPDALVQIVDAPLEPETNLSYLADRIRQSHPLPITKSDAGGEFSVLIHSLHVTFRRDQHSIGLLVKKPGYRTWREHLLVPLERNRHAPVVLPLLRAEDLCEVLVDDPRPGMKLEVSLPGHWSTFVSQGFYPFGRQVYEVPLDGRLNIEAAAMPLPARVPADENLVIMRYEGRILHPGVVGTPQALVGGARVRFAAKSTAAAGRTLSSMSGKALSSVRGLYRYSSGSQFWQELSEGVVPDLGEPRLIALSADGHLATTDVNAAQLLPLPAKSAGRRIRLVDPKGRGIRGARVSICDLALMPASGSAYDLIFGDSQVPVSRSDQDGQVDLPAVRLLEATFLLIEARGFDPRLVVEPRRFESIETLELQRVETGSLRVKIVDEDDNPVAGAFPFFWKDVPGHEYPMTYVPWSLGDFLVSDEQGIVLWEQVRTGFQLLPQARRVGYRGPSSWREHPEIEVGVITDWTIKMTSLMPYHVRLVDGAGTAVPFGVAKDERWNFNQGGSSGAIASYTADHEGWLHLQLLEEYGLELQEEIPGISGLNGESIPAREETKFEIRRIPSVMLRCEPNMALSDWVQFGARGMHEHHNRGGSYTGSSILLKSPRHPVLIGIEDSPPISYVPSDRLPVSAEGMLNIDRTRITRRVPLEITGAEAEDLLGLQVRPIAMNGMTFHRPLDSNMAARDADGGWQLMSRDDEEYDCVILHPDYLLEELRLPKASAKSAGVPIEVVLRPGKRIRIRSELSRDLPSPNYFRVAVMTKSWSLFGDGRENVLLSPVPFEGTIPKGVFEFQLPCGLEPGTKYVIMIYSFLGRSEVIIDVEDLEPETIEIPAMKR